MIDKTLSTCPKCTLRWRLKERRMANGNIRHECISCGYLMVWKGRKTTMEIRDETERRSQTNPY